MGRWSLGAFVVGGLLLVAAGPVQADHDGVVRFAVLPKPGPGFPEGIAADAAGNIFVGTFDFGTANVVHVFGLSGRLRETIPLPTGVVPLGLAVDGAGDLYVADFLNGNVLRLVPPSGTPAATFNVCGGVGAGCGLNAIAFDAAGDLFVSDSFGGKIFKIDLPGGSVSTFFEGDLLEPGSHGFPPFGANGLAFNAAGDLFIANTADDRILKLDLPAKALTIFAESINGADGIAFDALGRLWVAANQGDEVVALNISGRVIARRGSFEGVGPDGAPRGLLFPASIVLSRGSIFVTNLALTLTGADGDEPEEDVTTFTVSRIPVGVSGR
ncbi:MAG TPA: NHL repeat-containing protein [Candidatus Methylomirabilis sp.]|nr:NHL repeat-containing protein [Candidatus Methylomirabilis sp.]